MRGLLLAAAHVAAASASGACNTSSQLGFHRVVCDGAGNLALPAAYPTLQAMLDASVVYYSLSPRDLPLSHGLPPFVWATFTAGDYIPTSLDIIAAMQDGMGLIGYSKYLARARAGRGGDAAAAAAAIADLAEYMLAWASTPRDAGWAWPGVVRSTGLNIEWPLTTAAQTDALSGVNTIETDKVGLAGWALLLAANVTNNATYAAAALAHARALARWQAPGNATDAPWPFRVDAQTGAFLSGRKNGDAAFALRLFHALAADAAHAAEFAAPAAALWAWVRDVQLPTASAATPAADGLFVNFFEDKSSVAPETNRNSWTALELARFLIDSRATGLDADWRAHVDALLTYALALFGYPSNVGNVTLMGEQDNDRKGWGGASSKLGGVAAKYACAGGPRWLAALGANNARHMAYFTDPADGCRSAQAYLVGATPERGGWTEDAWLDVAHNLVDAAEAEDGFC
jgi:hypothetical protein